MSAAGLCYPPQTKLVSFNHAATPDQNVAAVSIALREELDFLLKSETYSEAEEQLVKVGVNGDRFFGYWLPFSLFRLKSLLLHVCICR